MVVIIFQARKLVHTYRPYFEEVQHMPEAESSNKSKKKKASPTAGAGSAALKVLAHLAATHTQILKILAKLQLSSSSNSVPYFKLKDELVKNYLSGSETKLRNILNELFDHNVLGWGKDEEGNEVVFVPPDIPLQSVIDFDVKAHYSQSK